jgi:hypothetical protein
LQYPSERPDHGNWHDLLTHSEQLASTLSEDWILHYDADEMRISPWPNTTLQEAISFVDSLGYNSIDFTVVNFGYRKSKEDLKFTARNFAFFDFGRHDSYKLQIKGWKNAGQRVELKRTAGHIAEFDGRNTFPLKFTNLHYPLRSREQARKKILTDRNLRFSQERQTRGWHVHYGSTRSDIVAESWFDHELKPYDPRIFAAEYLVERVSGIGIETHSIALHSVSTYISRENDIIAALEKTEAKLSKIEDIIKD